MATSIFQRKRDFAYLIFFLTHLPVMLAFDLTAYYPTSLKPLWMTAIRTFHVETYGDRFFYKPPPYFPTLLFLELVFHLPLTLWAIPALLRSSPRIPLALLVFGLETSITTLVCMADMWSWQELSDVQRGLGGLGGMYGGYLVFALLMSIDCYFRLDSIITRQQQQGGLGKNTVPTNNNRNKNKAL